MVRPRSSRGDEQIVRRDLTPTIGRQLAKLTAAHVRQLLNHHAASGLSAATVRRIRDMLRHALNQAVEWNLVPGSVAVPVAPPRAAPSALPSFPPRRRNHS